MRILVTGGAGFVGSALVRLLVARGDDVLVFDKLTYAGHLSSLDELSQAPNLTFTRGDICDMEALASGFVSFAPDGVVHLAAESHVDRSIAGAGAFIETNIVGTFRLLEVARAYWSGLASEQRNRFKFLHVSTDEVFGSLGADGLFTEESRYDPRSPYSASKAAADHLARAWAHTYGLPVLVSNCSNNYGPRQLPEKLVPLMILNALEGLPLPVYGDGGQIRDWLYVEDHAAALALILDSGAVGRTYNVGGRNERTNLDVVSAICDILDDLAPSGYPRRDLIRFVEDRPGHDRRYAIHAGRLETELGWRASEQFESGLRRTIQWYLDHEDWWRPLRDAGHGATRLGLVEGTA